MQRILLSVSVAILSITSIACAQYNGDPSSSYIDQMVRDHIDQRRANDYRRAARDRKGKGRSSKTQSRHSATTKQQHVNVKRLPMTGKLSFTQDMYSTLGEKDSREFTLEVRLMPVGKSGKPMLRWGRFTPSKGWGSTHFANIPVGRYVASARVIDAGKNVIQTLLGTQLGSPTDPQGGDFAATQTVELAVGKDQYQNRVIVQKRLIWFRPQISQ